MRKKMTLFLILVGFQLFGVEISAQEYPTIAEADRIARLNAPEGKVRMVLDTDTYNEIDDQFAVVYALLSKEKLDVEALYAAPFSNSRSTGPEDGMERSYEEILRLLDRLDMEPDGFVYKGSTKYLTDLDAPPVSPAALDLIERAKSASPVAVIYSSAKADLICSRRAL